MKSSIFAGIGILGSFLAGALGGWDTALQTLIIFMAIDYITGLIVAMVFRNSPKTEHGAAESNAAWKGLVKKGVTLLFVLIGAQLDLMMGSGLIVMGIEFTVRNTVIIGFMGPELISIVENAGLMGLPVPEIIKKAIEILNKQASLGGLDKEE
ncbi:phage holin family protein [Proteiniclasticum sp. BAD-10]|uniref:Phage holin family protein n=1 Tax=Proteiniclasticum sediminis TaxID=2804028 RepID=A0A941CRE2_9CLOT|nr:phage holin family protein [Proteiniclasticum sediminis]MBR0576744.1 phage holin family protein [Proteiniclasticum sediminis]